MSFYQRSLIMSDTEEFALAVASRRKGETLSYWSRKDRQLVVLFDEDPPRSWRQYEEGHDVLPGAGILLNGKSCMAGDLVSGIVIREGLDLLLTHYYAMQWQKQYVYMARRHNRREEKKDILFLWKLYSSFMLVQAQADAPEMLTEIRPYYEAFGDIIEKKLKQFAVPVHVPLITNESCVAYISN